MRTLSNEVKDHIGKSVHVEGWLHKKRMLGGLTFINVRDRRGLIQVVIDNKDEVEKLRGLQIGTVLAVDGKAVEEQRAPGGAELHDVKLTVIVPVEAEPPIEIDKPLSHKPDNLDTLFEHRVIGLRNLQEQKVFKIRAGLLKNIRSFLDENEFIEINTPKILAGATEGGAEVFKVDYFGREAVLAQSPQFYKQIMVGVYERVFEIAPAYRAELSATSRHVSELTMLDIEMGFIEGHEDVLEMVEKMTYQTLTKIYEEYGAELKSLNAPELKITEKFPRYTVAEVHELYGKANNVDLSKEKRPHPGRRALDLRLRQEKRGQ